MENASAGFCLKQLGNRLGALGEQKLRPTRLVRELLLEIDSQNVKDAVT